MQSVIAASSLGVTAKVLSDLGKLKSKIGLEIFTVTAIVEFIAIIVVSVFIQLDANSGTPEIGEMVWLFAKMLIFFAVAGLLSVFGLPHFFRLIKNHLRVKEAYFAIVIGVILLVAYFAEVSGVHGAIGALLLGIAVSRMNKEEYNEISKNISVIGYGIFIPIFFAGIGIHFSFAFLELEWWIIATFFSNYDRCKIFEFVYCSKNSKYAASNNCSIRCNVKGSSRFGIDAILTSSTNYGQ